MWWFRIFYTWRAGSLLLCFTLEPPGLSPLSLHSATKWQISWMGIVGEQLVVHTVHYWQEKFWKMSGGTDICVLINSPYGQFPELREWLKEASRTQQTHTRCPISLTAVRDRLTARLYHRPWTNTSLCGQSVQYIPYSCSDGWIACESTPTPLKRPITGCVRDRQADIMLWGTGCAEERRETVELFSQAPFFPFVTQTIFMWTTLWLHLRRDHLFTGSVRSWPEPNPQTINPQSHTLGEFVCSRFCQMQ